LINHGEHAAAMQALHYCTCGVRQLALKAPPCPLQAQQWVVNSTGGRDGEPVCHQAAGQAPPAGAACILPPACRCLRAAAVAACFSSSHSLCLLTQPRNAVLNLVMPSSWTVPLAQRPRGTGAAFAKPCAWPAPRPPTTCQPTPGLTPPCLQTSCCPGTIGSWSARCQRAGGPSPSYRPSPSSFAAWR
jgi:hypothetical protein